MRANWPLIRYRTSTPFRPWMIDCGMINGKRVRYSCASKTAAEARAHELRIQRKAGGDDSLLPARMSEDGLSALALLSPYGVSLSTAAKFYLANLEVVQASKSVAEVTGEFISAKEGDRMSERYLRDLRARLNGGFQREFGTRLIFEVSTGELETWLRRRSDWSATTRNNYARVIGTLFRFAHARGYLVKDPTERLSSAKVTGGKPAILSVDEARGLLGGASDEADAAVIALLLFAGLRPEAELMRLDWRAIDLEERLIDISSSKNSASHRFVRITDNLNIWLERTRKPSGAVSTTGDTFLRRMKAARLKGAVRLRSEGIPAPALEDWPPDACRHTFASMHYGAFKNAHETAEQLGHAGSLRIFFRHYRNRVREADAINFWQLFPPEHPD